MRLFTCFHIYLNLAIWILILPGNIEPYSLDIVCIFAQSGGERTLKIYFARFWKAYFINTVCTFLSALLPTMMLQKFWLSADVSTLEYFDSSFFQEAGSTLLKSFSVHLGFQINCNLPIWTWFSRLQFWTFKAFYQRHLEG